MLTYNAYEKGILPEPGGLGSQPLKFLPMIALIASRTGAEADLERNRKADAGRGGKRSVTEEYLETAHHSSEPEHQTTLASPTYDAEPQIFNRGRNPTIPGRSPDGLAAVPGLLKPRMTRKR